MSGAMLAEGAAGREVMLTIGVVSWTMLEGFRGTNTKGTHVKGSARSILVGHEQTKVWVVERKEQRSEQPRTRHESNKRSRNRCGLCKISKDKTELDIF